MSYKSIISPKKIFLALFSAALLSWGCATTGTDSTANSNRGTTVNSNANSNSAPASSVPVEAQEPERYSIVTKIVVEPTGTTPQRDVPAMQFAFARDGANRRLSFSIPDPVGEVVYIEKAPMKYLIFPARNQYVELDPNELGFQFGDLMSPTAAIERLKERAQYERLGTETVNGRTAIKYRFAGSTDTKTRAGTVHADSILFVDQETGLPLRTEVDTNLSSGQGARIVTTTDEIKLNPEPSLFEIPTGMNKVTSAELKRQVQSFVSAMRVAVQYLRQEGIASQPAGAR
jgi:hypothetical protein